MRIEMVYELEPVFERGKSRIGGDAGLYRIKVY